MMYDPREPTGCAEEDALEVMENARANFCDYFKPTPDAYSPGLMQAQSRAESELDALFGDDRRGEATQAGAGREGGAEEDDDSLRRAEDLFKS